MVVEGYALEPLSAEVSAGFSRVTTVVRMYGAGEEGLGEDVSYAAQDQLHLARRGAHLPLAGDHTIASLAARLDGLELHPDPPTWPEQRPYRRWAFESAALDLALRQAGRSLAQALGRTPSPPSFVVSLGLGDPPDPDRVQRWLRRDPSLRFKLDADPSWDDALVAALAATGAVPTIDLKGAYPTSRPPDPALYQRVVQGFPDAWLEDPALTDGTRAALAGHEDRLTWDAPIHGVADIDACEHPPRCINIKPSRFGPLQKLMDTYDTVAARGMTAYGGGQFELGPGRGQVQCLAALFHPHAPNDVAPRGYNEDPPPREVPPSPLAAPCAELGFRGEGDA